MKSVPYLLAKLRDAFEIAVIGHVDALALDRLDEKAGDLLAFQRIFQRGQIVERHLHAIGQKAAEPFAENRVAVERQRAIGEAVERMAAIGDAGAAGRGAREFDRGFDAFGAGIGEEDFVEMRHAGEQPLGQYARERRHIHLNEIGQLAIEHLPQRIMYAPDGCARSRTHPSRSRGRDIWRPGGRTRYCPCPRTKPTSKPMVLSTRTICSFRWRVVQPVTFGFALGEQGFDVNAHFNLPPPGRGTVAPVKSF